VLAAAREIHDIELPADAPASPESIG